MVNIELNDFVMYKGYPLATANKDETLVRITDEFCLYDFQTSNILWEGNSLLGDQLFNQVLNTVVLLKYPVVHDLGIVFDYVVAGFEINNKPIVPKPNQWVAFMKTS